MSNRPPITIIMTTYMPNDEAGISRRRAAREARASWSYHLQYGDGSYFDSDKLRLHVADDGSTLYGWPDKDVDNGGLRPYHTDSRQERHGVGASLNVGLTFAHNVSPLSAYFVDDWRLDADFDLTPWADLLMRDETVGMVRLGPPHPNISGTVIHDEGLWYLRLHPHHYAFGHRPALYHKRFYDWIGYYKEDCSALECEYDMNERYKTKAGWGGNLPEIVLALPHPWSVIPNAELGDIDPTTEHTARP